MDIQTIKTRFAPSPTGLMHLGNVRTALFNALYAYRLGGTFVLRIEDTDLERSRAEYTEQLLVDLKWLGLIWQEGPGVGDEQISYYQSARNEIYSHYYQQLEQQELVYPCFCSPQELAISRKIQRAAGQPPRYSGTCTHLSQADIAKKCEQGILPTLRFRVIRDQQVEFTDFVRGQQQFATNDIGDFIIRRADGTPAFFFCNAIDDAVMGVTHVLRGEDHLANTPRQQLILQALGLPVPQYGHISMILGHDNSPLSKRNGSQSIEELRREGWLAEGILNYLARLGHTYSEEGYLPLTGLADHFLLERLVKAPAHFDEQQLKHWQQMAIQHLEDARLWVWMGEEVHAVVPDEVKLEFVKAVRSNVIFPKDALKWAQILFAEDWVISSEAQEVVKEAGQNFFQHALTALQISQGDYQQLVTVLKQETGAKGKRLFMPLRAALTGETQGPEMVHLLPLMGIQRAEKRLMFGTTL